MGLAQDNKWFTEQWLVLKDDFRTLKQPGQVIPASFGCSFTYGDGVEVDQTWSFLLDVANMGLPGASNDYISRMAVTYCKLYNPTDIYVMWTFPNRREVVDEDGTLLKYKAYDPGSENYAWYRASVELSNDHSDSYNLAKNKILLESFCKAENINLHQISVDTVNHVDMNSIGTDGQHPGVEWHDTVAEYLRTY